jgi:prepilin-type N-terminal cleavage/methylation domain-containing protein
MSARRLARTAPNLGHGFTFLEVLLAVAVAGLLLVAASQMLFTFTRLWQQVEEEPLFAHHVDGVVRFLEYCLESSDNISGDENRPFSWRKVRKMQSNDRLFYFRLDPSLPFFVDEVPTRHPVDAWLAFDEEKGLSILWHLPRSLTEGRIKLHETPLSPWVEDVEIATFQPDRNVYEYESYNEDGIAEKREAPQALRILFNQNGKRQTRQVRLRRYDRHVLIY